jgi:hypothetical protein
MGRHGVAGIFGEHTVDVEHNPSALSWVVKAVDGRVLLQIPWYWAYDQTMLGKRVYSRRHFLTNDEYVAHSSRWEAFEVCMCACPLTAAEKQLLEAGRPGLTSRPQYVVVDPIWQPESRIPQLPAFPLEPPLPSAPRNRTPRTVPATPVVVETQPLPTETKQPEPETAHEAGERKLLL